MHSQDMVGVARARGGASDFSIRPCFAAVAVQDGGAPPRLSSPSRLSHLLRFSASQHEKREQGDDSACCAARAVTQRIPTAFKNLSAARLYELLPLACPHALLLVPWDLHVRSDCCCESNPRMPAPRRRRSRIRGQRRRLDLVPPSVPPPLLRQRSHFGSPSRPSPVPPPSPGPHYVRSHHGRRQERVSSRRGDPPTRTSRTPPRRGRTRFHRQKRDRRLTPFGPFYCSDAIPSGSPPPRRPLQGLPLHKLPRNDHHARPAPLFARPVCHALVADLDRTQQMRRVDSRRRRLDRSRERRNLVARRRRAPQRRESAPSPLFPLVSRTRNPC